MGLNRAMDSVGFRVLFYANGNGTLGVKQEQKIPLQRSRLGGMKKTGL